MEKSRANQRTEMEGMHVCVRIRPNAAEETHPSLAELSPAQGEYAASIGSMQFNAIYHPKSTNLDVFRTSVKPTVDSWVEGYHGCVFAYGQTSSGKTHTMLGPDGGQHLQLVRHSHSHANQTNALAGVIPQAVDLALARMEQELAQWRALSTASNAYRLQVSFVELYNDELRDLLLQDATTSSSASAQQIRLREDASGSVYVFGSRKVTVTSVSEAIQLVQRGSNLRATGRTNMNEHSSRSHAIFTLHLQHRWLDANSGKIKSTESDLHMVDLAGSEYAKRAIDMSGPSANQQFAESIAINTGLYTLGNVIAALAGQRRVGTHIPYRDSTLTRMLQNALGGNSRTVMIACVNPGSSHFDESMNTLKYAAAAVSIVNKPLTITVDVADEDDGAEVGDAFPDPESAIDRRCVWINTVSYGPVYARCIGHPGDELVLFVHGSGPTNSSTWWLAIMWQLHLLSPTPLLLVAIDCPGYGRSPGDRQVIRSEPAAFLTEIVRGLGKDAALCAVGSSQGSCAVFNAALDAPSLFKSIAVMDPVGHDVFRYSNIRVPVLLTFDTEDDGHPVKVGRWMRDALPNATYFEFAASREPFWHTDHFPAEILKILEKAASHRGMRRSSHSHASAATTTAAGGILPFAEHRGFGEPMKEVATGFLAPLCSFFYETFFSGCGDKRLIQATAALPKQSTTWRPHVDALSSRVYYMCEETGEKLWRRPESDSSRSVIILPAPHSRAAEITAHVVHDDPVPREEPSGKHCPTVALFEEEIAAHEAQQQKSKEAQKAEKEQMFLGQTLCELCNGHLWMPRRMSICEHILCSACVEKRGTRYSEQCPVCGLRSPLLVMSQEHQARLSDELPLAVQDAARDVIRLLSDDSARCLRIIVEYGNTASRAGTAIGSKNTVFTCCSFARVKSMAKGSKLKRTCFTDAGRALTRVEFDINPDFPKAAIKVTSPPFTLERSMAMRYSCNLRLYFADGVGLPVEPLVIPYEVEHDPSTTRRLVILLAEEGSAEDASAAAVAGVAALRCRREKPKPFVVNHEEGVVLRFAFSS